MTSRSAPAGGGGVPGGDDDDEARLLASLGTAAASASSYERDVLRDAALRSAPRIVLPPSVVAVAVGVGGGDARVPASGRGSGEEDDDDRPALPDLSSLAPSTASSRGGKAGSSSRRQADAPHVAAVLARTRDRLRSAPSAAGDVDGDDEGTRERRIDALRMKEQMLLGYLIDVAGLDEDDPMIPRAGRKRRRSGDGGEYYGNRSAREAANDASAEAVAGKGGTKRSSNDRSKNREVEASLGSSSASRLDRIKNGEDLDAVRRKPLRRTTMMQMKSQMRRDDGLAPLKTMEEERFDAERSRRRREERRRRRRRRQRALLGLDGSDDEEGEEAEFDAKPEKKPAKKPAGILKKAKKKEEEAGVVVREEKKTEEDDRAGAGGDDGRKEGGVRFAGVDGGGASITTDGGKKKRTHTKVFCPVCQQILTAEDGEEKASPDEFLARHVAECQAARRARNGGRTLRRRKKPAYVESGDDEDDVDRDDARDEADALPAADESEAFVAPAESDAAEEELEGAAGADDEGSPPNEKRPPASVDDLDDLDYEDRVDDWIERGLGRMSSMSERDEAERPPGAVAYDGGLEVPGWVNDRLFPYQRTGVRWMWELHRQGAGGVVGDEMGLGKTVQVSSFLGAMAASRFLDSVLVVAPATMLAHWLSELATWAPGLRRVMVHRSGETDGVSRAVSRGMLRSLRKWLRRARADRVNEPIDERDCDEGEEHSFCGTGYAVVTTYESIRRSPDEWTDHPWSYVVLDEGQKIRNPDADVTLACKRLRTPHRLLLSGTPIQNDLRELWSLYDFIFPGRLGTLPAFEAEFAEPIKRGGYSNASPMQVQLAYRCALVLRDLINPFMLRRQKKDVKEVNRMPGKTEQVLFCRLSSKQRSLYEEYLKSGEVMGVMRGSVQLLKAVTVLRKICNHPDLVTGPNGDSLLNTDGATSSSTEEEDVFDEEKLADRSGKLQVLSKILPLWHKQGHKVIIFTQWRKMLHIIERFVRQKEWKYSRLDGNTNIASRQKLVDNFNSDASYFCLLMTTRTGGVGLNITGANRVLLYDPDWNPQTDAQARERAWRFGQKRDVTVYRLITAGAIEEKIYQRQIFKTALTNQVLTDPKQRRLFSQRDLKDLFTLKEDAKGDVTETGEITKGEGVVETNATFEAPDEQATDNHDTLETAMKSKGLCGVFDHAFVENPSAKKSMSVVEMEENARKVALQAAKHLKESAENQSIFEPTWTGSDETRQFGGASTAGVAGPGGNTMTSSSSLLANLQKKRVEIASSGKAASSHSDANKYSGLLLRIRKYIRRMASRGNSPTTRDLLNFFKDVADSDAAIFRSMLKSTAVMKNGRWIEKSES
ncbi:hypothetical protein ACHAWF_014429 [Thalassiosira exigua]